MGLERGVRTVSIGLSHATTDNILNFTISVYEQASVYFVLRLNFSQYVYS